MPGIRDYPIVGVVIRMNSSRCFTIKDVDFCDLGYGHKRACVYYVDADPSLVGGNYPVRKGSPEFFDLEEEINKILSNELYYSLIKIESEVILLECSF